MNQKKQEGFSLLEALTALVILTVGLMGLAAMQDISVSRSMDANELGVATSLTTDMLDRIQFNWRRVKFGAYTNIDTQNAGTRPPSTEPEARGDYDQWQARLNNSLLRNVRGQVSVAQTGPINLDQFSVNVQVSWAGTQGSALLGRSRTVTMQTLVGPR